jgi:transcriptional regulator with XRE-family HTH domain
MNERQIRAWMILRGLRVKDVAVANRVSSTAISRFLNGKLRSARIHQWFRRCGCPVAYLGASNTKARRAA